MGPWWVCLATQTEAYLIGGPVFSPRAPPHVPAPYPCSPGTTSPESWPWALVSATWPTTVSLTDGRRVKKTCVSDGEGGLELIDATPAWWDQPPCSHSAWLISSAVRAFHHVVCAPIRADLLLIMAPSPALRPRRQAQACLQDEKLFELLGVRCS